MTAHRVVVKLTGVGLACSAGVVSMALTRLYGRFAPEGHVAREDRIVRRWAQRMCRILRLDVETHGTPPTGDFLLVCNHLSYVDVIVIMSQVDARLLSKAEVKGWPVMGWLARYAGTLFVDRERRRDLPRVIGEIRAMLALGRGVVFFPEGTSSPGLELLPFKPSLLEVAAAGELPLATAALRYETPPGERPAQWSVSWWGDMEFVPHLLAFLRLPRVAATLTYGDEPVRGSERKELALAAQDAMQKLFEPVADELGEDAPTPKTSR